LEKAILQDINSKNGPVRAEAAGNELRDRSLPVESATGLSDGLSVMTH
jgi:hypothetical protein